MHGGGFVLRKVLIGVLAAFMVSPVVAQVLVGAPAPTIPDTPQVQPIVPNPTPPTPPVPTNTTSQTCTPTMAMIGALNCGIYPAPLQAFCNLNKPLLMDMAHCQSAEKYAQNVPPGGSHLDECKTSTFGTGTGSWSYVLACAKTSSNQGQFGSGTQALNKLGITDVSGTGGGTGGGTAGGSSGGASGSGVAVAAADPGCLAKLQGSGAKFTNLGQRRYSGPAGSCTVANDVKYSNQDVTYTAEMDCNLAVMWENFGKKLKALGVTKVGSFGTLGCRNMNNGKSSNTGHLSKHAYGYAADMEPFTINGQTYSGSRYFSDPTARAQIQSMVQAACESFNLTLAFRYYKGRQGIHHIHAQFTQHNCDPDNG
jgi:hypothetical protein